jgi:hypothetical protein
MFDARLKGRSNNMRTTLTIDDDVLMAAKGLAESQHKNIGEIISSLARQALQRVAGIGGTRNGVPLLPTRSGTTIVTPELVNQLRDELL